MTADPASRAVTAHRRRPALEAVEVTRTYELDGVSVEALRGVSLAVGTRATTWPSSARPGPASRR